MTKPQGKPPVRHSMNGIKVKGFAGRMEARPLCGAESWGFPEKWVATEEWLHEIKACPKCKELEPTLQGWDEMLKEKYGDAWNDYKERERINMTLASEEQYLQKQTPPQQTVRQGLYLRQYARR